MSMEVQEPSPSLSSSSTLHWKFDVFLSFRGEDTRRGFTDHLYNSLKWQGFDTFRDDEEIESGKAISPELLEAIKSSRIAVIVLSRNYASSTWCLDELVEILQCMKTKGQRILPVFYEIDPSVARKQKEDFQRAFSKHEETFREEIDRVRKWRTALTEVANLKGWYSKDWFESVLIREIVETVWTIVRPTLVSTEEGLIGIDSKFEQLVSLLDMESAGVELMGIWGMGGIGKTTIARAVYDRIHHKYKVSSFLANVREVSQRSGLVFLQKQLLSRVIKEKDNIWDVREGSVMVVKVLRHKKVLLVLDDVDQLNQLKAFIQNKDGFGSGSRIIITTRDEALLISGGVEKRYKVEELECEESLRLFSLNAFKRIHPDEGYRDLSIRVVEITGGLPLALKVLGSFLHNRALDVWNDAVDKLKEVPNKEIFETLKISFDGLDQMEKDIFFGYCMLL